MPDQDFNIKVVTTADTSGLLQTKAQMEALAQQMKSAEQVGFQLGQALRVIAGGAVIAGGYKFVSDLNSAAASIEKISVELGKQGNQIVINAQKFAEMAKFAQDNADVIKVGEGALKGVEQAHEKLLEAAGKELTTWQKIQDVWTSGFDLFKRGVPRPQADALKIEQDIRAQNLEMARTAAIMDITAAKTEVVKRANETLDQTIARLTARMKEQETLSATHWAQKDIESYLATASAAEKYRQEIEKLNAEKAKATQQTGKNIEAADPQVKAVLMNEEAARVAREQGRDRDAELFQRSADRFKQSATPGQRDQIQKAEADPNLIQAIHDLSNKMDRYWQ